MTLFLKCPYCKRIDPFFEGEFKPKEILCVTCLRWYNTSTNIFTKRQLIGNEQMKLDDILFKSFKKPGGKTLKLEIAPDTKLADAVADAIEYLNHENNVEHNRIEFKYGRNYIVIAKLKE